MPGIWTSSSTRSGRTATAFASASGPSRAVTTSKPSNRRLISTKRRMSASSSATSTVAGNTHPSLAVCSTSTGKLHERIYPPQVPHHPAASPPGESPGGLAAACLLALQQPHVGGLGALGPLRHVELDGLPLGERAVAGRLDRAEMHEDVNAGL